ncbi:MAG TPA: N-acetylornithine carbamoyltransferase [Cytophagales bacterium]|nr:N-acetylornithine carbamoyltransferase [Cytophagales bacterium]
MQNFISFHDVDDLDFLVKSALEIKKNPYANSTLGINKTIGLLFLNPSLRTRLSTQKAAQNLGMNVITFNLNNEGWAIEVNEGIVMDGTSSEHIKEAAAVIGQYCDVIGLRSFPGLTDREYDYADTIINKFVQYAGRPILSLESAILHPLQSLTDVITVEELKTKSRPKVVLSWAPHTRALPQAVPNSFSEWMSKAEVDFVITHPKGYELSNEFTQGVKIEYDQDKAFEGADFIYAKNWSSFREYGKILTKDPAWMITEQKMALTDSAKFMHCLPVRRNVVVADEVLDSENSIVIHQAGNREFAAQAVLTEMLKGM